MASIQKFEDLYSWQRARQLTVCIYKLTRKPEFSRDRGLANQIQRSAVSVMANQAEGFVRGTKAELINYFYIAKASAGETQSHLYIAQDLGYINIEEFKNAYDLASQSQKLIEHFVQRVKASARGGLQYKKPKTNHAEIIELQEIIANKRSIGEATAEDYKKLFRLQGLNI